MFYIRVPQCHTVKKNSLLPVNYLDIFVEKLTESLFIYLFRLLHLSVCLSYDLDITCFYIHCLNLILPSLFLLHYIFITLLLSAHVNFLHCPSSSRVWFHYFLLSLTPGGEQSNLNKHDWQMAERAHPYFSRVPGKGWCCRLPRDFNHTACSQFPLGAHGGKQILVHDIDTQGGFWSEHKHIISWPSEHPPWVGGKRPWQVSALSSSALLSGHPHTLPPRPLVFSLSQPGSQLPRLCDTPPPLPAAAPTGLDCFFLTAAAVELTWKHCQMLSWPERWRHLCLPEYGRQNKR